MHSVIGPRLQEKVLSNELRYCHLMLEDAAGLDTPFGLKEKTNGSAVQLLHVIVVIALGISAAVWRSSAQV